MAFTVYVLKDPVTDEVRYVGCTHQKLQQRLSTHVSLARAGKRDNSCYAWVRALDKRGLRPLIAEVSTHFMQHQAATAEVAAIAHYRTTTDLLNKADGGPGAAGVRRSKRTRKLMGDAKRGVPKTKEHRRKLAAANGGRPFKDNKGRVYQTLREAEEKLGINYQNIRRALIGNRPRAGGLSFRYLADVN